MDYKEFKRTVRLYSVFGEDNLSIGNELYDFLIDIKYGYEVEPNGYKHYKYNGLNMFFTSGDNSGYFAYHDFVEIFDQKYKEVYGFDTFLNSDYINIRNIFIGNYINEFILEKGKNKI